ncbi:MFS transporter, partial [Chloroflexota bacterium]
MTSDVILLGTRSSFGVFFLSLQNEFALTRGITSGVFSVYMVLSGLISIFWGWTLDRYGPRSVILMMGLFTGLSL